MSSSIKQQQKLSRKWESTECRVWSDLADASCPAGSLSSCTSCCPSKKGFASSTSLGPWFKLAAPAACSQDADKMGLGVAWHEMDIMLTNADTMPMYSSVGVADNKHSTNSFGMLTAVCCVLRYTSSKLVSSEHVKHKQVT